MRAGSGPRINFSSEKISEDADPSKYWTIGAPLLVASVLLGLGHGGDEISHSEVEPPAREVCVNLLQLRILEYCDTA
jgi:hypothetical protein